MLYIEQLRYFIVSQPRILDESGSQERSSLLNDLFIFRGCTPTIFHHLNSPLAFSKIFLSIWLFLSLYPFYCSTLSSNFFPLSFLIINSFSFFYFSPSFFLESGWSTSVPTYNPREIISNLRLMIAGECPVEMHPWYRGFKGPYVLINFVTHSYF